jgi:hypothetical protein
VPHREAQALHREEELGATHREKSTATEREHVPHREEQTLHREEELGATHREKSTATEREHVPHRGRARATQVHWKRFCAPLGRRLPLWL